MLWISILVFFLDESVVGIFVNLFNGHIFGPFILYLMPFI